MSLTATTLPYHLEMACTSTVAPDSVVIGVTSGSGSRAAAAGNAVQNRYAPMGTQSGSSATARDEGDCGSTSKTIALTLSVTPPKCSRPT